MQMLLTRTHWSRDFLVALDLVGAASARLPFGVPDPVLCSGAALALYTGGLWPVEALEIAAVDAGTLVAELFAIGFRASRGSRNAELWHPDCPIGLDIRPMAAPATPGEQANQLRLALDGGPNGPSAAATLKVIGIEDLIVDVVRSWLLDGAPAGEPVIVLQALVASARAGVGGPLRTTYLQRRLAAETNGEVCIDDLPVEAGREPVGMPRAIRLTEMQARIHAWRAPQGLVADTPRTVDANRLGDALMRGIDRRRDGSSQGGQWDLRLVTIPAQ
jgi:hypothetical protein